MAGDIIIQISEDGFQATVASIQSRTKIEEVAAALQEAGVVHGIRSSGINAAIAEAGQSAKPLENVVVAGGDRPDYAIPPSLAHRPRDEEGELPSLKSLRSLMLLATPEEIEAAAADAGAIFVKSGDLLAVKSAGEVKPGKNVKGEVIEKLADEEEKYPHFLPGPGVKLEKGGTEFRAALSGYAGLMDGKISVLPPVWMPEDKMQAMYLNVKLLPGSLQPTVPDIVEAFAAVDVTEGIDQERVQAVSNALAKGGFKRALVVVATGTPSKPPVDAEADFSFEHQAKAGAERKDGSIDLRERQTFPSVAEEALLIEARPPAPGTPGMTVTGEEVAVREPDTIELVAGENVKLTQEGEVQQLYSEIDGGASVNESAVESESGTHTTYTVSIRSLAQVPGDVDYSTGNIDFKGNVEIKGRVVSGFKVKATGDIIISEGIEDGVEISGDGSLSVRQGIVGSKTKVKVKGNVEAKFIQDALGRPRATWRWMPTFERPRSRPTAA